MGLPQSTALDVLDAITGRGVYSTYLALCTADPGVDPTVADVDALEPTDTGYARVEVTWAAPVWDTTDALTDNSAIIEFGPFPDVGGFSGVTYLALVTSASGTTGTVRHVWATPAEVTCDQDEGVAYAISALEIRQEV